MRCGVIIERVAVQQFVCGFDSWLIATVALGIVLDNVVLFTSARIRGMPPGLSTRRGDDREVRVQLSYLQISSHGIGLLLAAGLQILSRPHVMARRCRGGAEQRRGAADGYVERHHRVRAFWFRHRRHSGPPPLPSRRWHAVGIKAPSPFSAALKRLGMVLAGLIYGVAEALITALLSSTYTQIVTFALHPALALRPTVCSVTQCERANGRRRDRDCRRVPDRAATIIRSSSSPSG